MKSLFTMLIFVNFLNAMHTDQKSDAQKWKVVGKKGKSKIEFPSYPKAPKDNEQSLRKATIIPVSDTKNITAILVSSKETKEFLEEIFKKPSLTRNQKKRERNRAAQKLKKAASIAPEKYSSYLAVYNDGPYDF